MAMTLGGSKTGPVADVNVTPLIDVLLVLLLIFMVITPLLPKGLDALVPQPRSPRREKEPLPSTIVVSVNSQHQIQVNQEPVALNALAPRLQNIFKTRSERVMFVKGDPDVHFGDVAAIIDIAKGAGVDKIGLITQAVEKES